MDTRGVSPVVGSILAIAIVVVLAGVIMLFVTGGLTQPSASATAGVEVTPTPTDACTAAELQVIAQSNTDTLYYQTGGDRARIDDDGDGQTEVGETVTVAPLTAASSTTVTILARPHGTDSLTVVATRTVDATVAPTDCVVTSVVGGVGATAATHRLTYNITNGSDAVGNSLNGVTIDYPADFNVSETAATTASIDRVGFDTDYDGEIDRAVGDDLDSLTTSNNSTALELSFSGNYDVQGDEVFIVEYGNVTNPGQAGAYTVSVNFNGDESQSDTLDIE